MVATFGCIKMSFKVLITVYIHLKTCQRLREIVLMVQLLELIFHRRATIYAS